MFQENSIETCMLSRVKQITSPGWMHETSAQTWCTGKTQRDRVEREVGGGIGMGNTCKSMANSCQCMTKTTTILKKKKLRKKLKKQTNKQTHQRLQYKLHYSMLKKKKGQDREEIKVWQIVSQAAGNKAASGQASTQISWGVSKSLYSNKILAILCS